MAKKIEKTQAITQEGYDELVAELEEAKKKQQEIINKVQIAREDGDLSENAPYHAAREELSYINGHIDELESILKTAVITENTSKNNIGIGTKVRITNKENDKVIEGTLVGPSEADFAAGKISADSPIGKAIMGKKSGAVVTVKAPKGDAKYKVEIIK